jgi:hypothetical protein
MRITITELQNTTYFLTSLIISFSSYHSIQYHSRFIWSSCSAISTQQTKSFHRLNYRKTLDQVLNSIPLISIKIQVHSIGISIRGIVTFYQVIDLETKFLVENHSRSPQGINMKRYTVHISGSAFLNCCFQQCLSMPLPPTILLHWVWFPSIKKNTQIE